MKSNDTKIKQLEKELDHKGETIKLLKKNIEVLKSNIKIIEGNYLLATGTSLYKDKPLKVSFIQLN